MTNGLIPAPLAPAAARAQMDRLRQGWCDFWFELRDFHERQGWVALGYGNFKECVGVELGFTERRAYQLLDAARVVTRLRTEPWFSA
jgi:hypothetical protein